MSGYRLICVCSLFFFILCLFIIPCSSDAESTSDVTDIRYWSYPDYTRVVVTLSDTAEFSKNRLSNPDRLYFDIRKSRLKTEMKANMPVGNEMLKQIRASQFNEDTVRIVLDLEKIKDYKVVNIEDPVRIMIDIYGYAQASGKKRIVIDPGHGGHDPGAVGLNKLYEKDVVLDIARKMRSILSEDPKLEIFLTRDSDIFIPLEERTAIANSKNADLFVSVHANASPRREAKGIETYLLNWTNDEEAMKVAARENRISLKKMKKMQKEFDILDIIKGDLMRENKRDESIKLAHNIQRTLVSDVNREYVATVDHGVKQALFYVLFGAKMPSVLVEVSFISNPLEEKLLANETYRGDLAKSIAVGISKYMLSSTEVQTVVKAGKYIDPGD